MTTPTRLTPIDHLDADQTRLLHTIVGHDVPPPPPFLMWAHSPGAAVVVEPLGAYCRDESVLPERLRILSMLITGRFFSSGSMWNAHYDQALGLGLDPAALVRLARGVAPQFPDADDDLFWRFGDELLREHVVSDALYAEIVARFGEDGAVDAVTLVGNFTLGSFALNTFQVPIEVRLGWPFPDRPVPAWWSASEAEATL